jgi:hypothetical protein
MLKKAMFVPEASFPRKRESRKPWKMNAFSFWTPAFAGVTGFFNILLVLRGRPHTPVIPSW